MKHKQRYFSDDVGPGVVAAAVRSARPTRLQTIRKMSVFRGPGIYMLYYSGDEPLYRAIRVDGKPSAGDSPIYTGQSDGLHGRLMDHIVSLTCARNLRLSDFWFRFLALENPVHKPSVEELLIRDFCPVWNKMLDGFGCHDPGKSCRTHPRSKWDAVHPGRRWAMRRELTHSPTKLRAEVRRFLGE